MKNSLQITPPDTRSVFGTIKLPASKSISNRVLIIKALCEKGFEIDNLSEADDTKILIRELKNEGITPDINAGHAGTAMRFLTSYLAIRPGTHYLTGSDRMKLRPIAPLVSALQQLGADISYDGQPGFPPLKIKGKKLKGGKISVEAGISSQFISSLLLIAPLLEDGLHLEFKGVPVSTSYVKMTLGIMAHFGIEATLYPDRVIVKPGQYQSRDIFIEPDWSGVSYFYELLLLSEQGKLFFPGLTEKSLQGDAILWKWFKDLGINTQFEQAGAYAEKVGSYPQMVSYDFKENPDLAQTFAMAFAGLGIEGNFRGLETLPLKETDRIKALQIELEKLRYSMAMQSDGLWQLKKQKEPDPRASFEFETYNDHRMAMACAPLALKLGQLIIHDPEVVSKSFPDYWENLKSLGFTLLYRLPKNG